MTQWEGRGRGQGPYFGAHIKQVDLVDSKDGERLDLLMS